MTVREEFTVNREFQAICNYMESCMREMAHDREHVWRVLSAAADIARHVPEKVDLRILTAACLLHDIGRPEQDADPSVDHAEVGAEKAYRFLTGIGWTEEDAGRVRDCIAAHRYRSGGQPPAAIEGKILFDADKLDVTGAMGIARTLLYEGAHDEPLYLIGADGMPSEGNLPGEESFIHEYCFKLSKLADRFFTDYARNIALRRMPAAEQFYLALKAEITEGCAARNWLMENLGD